MPYQLVKQETKLFSLAFINGADAAPFPEGTVFSAAVTDGKPKLVDISIDTQNGELTVTARNKVGPATITATAFLPDGSRIEGCFNVEVADIQPGAQEHRYLALSPENFA